MMKIHLKTTCQLINSNDAENLLRLSSRYNYKLILNRFKNVIHFNTDQNYCDKGSIHIFITAYAGKDSRNTHDLLGKLHIL